MQILEDKITIEKSEGFNPTESSFAIDTGPQMVKMLREKTYSNKIRVCCQEPMSNARDAHREAGHNKPIKVFLPNKLSPYYKVQDFGIGIDPWRMENIVIVFGRSTKRNSNIFTGGFGLGAKVPLAYSDSFSIVTISAETGHNIKRTYMAYIDESAIGKMALVSAEDTSEDTGTTIIVPAKPDDFNEFKEWTYNTAKYWDVKPEVDGNSNFNWTNINKKVVGTNWYTIEDTNSYGSSFIVTVDDIPYELNWTTIRNALSKLDPATRVKVDAIYSMGCNSYTKAVLNFGNGELAIAINREELDYNTLTINTIIDRIKLVADEFRKTVVDYISTIKTLTEANLYWSALTSSVKSIVGEVLWNGKLVSHNYAFPEATNAYIYTYERRMSQVRLKSTSGRSLVFNESVVIVENDLSEDDKSERRRVNTLFDNRNVDRVFVINFPTVGLYAGKKQGHLDYYARCFPNDPVSYKLNVSDLAHNKIETIIPFSKAEDRELLNKCIYLNDLNIVKLSSVMKKAINRSSGPRSAMPVFYVYDKCEKHGTKSWNGVADPAEIDFENDDNIYVELASRNLQGYTDGKNVSYYNLDLVKKLYPDEDIIGIPVRHVKKLGSNWRTVHQVIENKIKEMELELDSVIKEHGDLDAVFTCSFGSNYSNLNYYGIKDAIKELPDESIAKKYLLLSEQIASYQGKYDELKSVKGNYGISCAVNPVINNVLKDAKNEFDVMYPLLERIASRYNANVEVEDIIKYIKDMDELTELRKSKELINV